MIVKPISHWPPDPLYHALMGERAADRDEGLEDPGLLDAHVFACILAQARHEGVSPGTALGLDPPALRALAAALFPSRGGMLTDDPGDREQALEEADLRRLLLAHRADGAPVRTWMAHAVARRSLSPGHLWEALGLRRREELSALLARHFPALAERNFGMKWKKFFYRQLCQMEGIVVCKSPNCAECPDYTLCFVEPGP